MQIPVTRVPKIIAVAWLLAGFALLSACAATGKAPVEASNPEGAEMIATSPAQLPPTSYRFYPGDELAVTVIRRPELSIPARVDPYGYITYPYLGQVHIQGLTPTEVAERLTRGLQEGEYYTNFVLSVSLVSSKDQFVYVLGEVKRPGPVSITGSMTLLSAISSAGGQTYDAEMSTVLWIRGRQSPPGVVKMNLNALGNPRSTEPPIPNFAMIPGDVLYIPDSVIASVERFMGRMYNIIRPVVELERGIVLYPDVERALKGDTEGGRTINIIAP